MLLVIETLKVIGFAVQNVQTVQTVNFINHNNCKSSLFKKMIYLSFIESKTFLRIHNESARKSSERESR